jgi:hypothetical protein
MRPEDKQWIDGATYEQLLQRWRFAPTGDEMFQDDTGDYYQRVMAKRKIEIGPEAAVQASKMLGWA